MSATLPAQNIDAEDPHLEIPLREIDTCFQIADSGELHLDVQKTGTSILNYLAYCVVRNPSDLLNHVRRIMLYGLTNERESLYGALMDLFIVLGSRGNALRSRLVNQYRSKLSDYQYQVLLKCEESSVSADQIPNCTSSVLTKGLIGTCSLVKFPIEPKEESKVRDALDEAQEYLEFSQIDAARQVLEQAVLENPRRIELHTELLELYRARRDAKNFQKIYHQLSKAGILLSDDWSAVSDFLLENEEHVNG